MTRRKQESNGGGTRTQRNRIESPSRPQVHQPSVHFHGWADRIEYVLCVAAENGNWTLISRETSENGSRYLTLRHGRSDVKIRVSDHGSGTVEENGFKINNFRGSKGVRRFDIVMAREPHLDGTRFKRALATLRPDFEINAGSLPLNCREARETIVAKLLARSTDSEETIDERVSAKQERGAVEAKRICACCGCRCVKYAEIQQKAICFYCKQRTFVATCSTCGAECAVKFTVRGLECGQCRRSGAAVSQQPKSPPPDTNKPKPSKENRKPKSRASTRRRRRRGGRRQPTYTPRELDGLSDGAWAEYQRELDRERRRQLRGE